MAEHVRLFCGQSLESQKQSVEIVASEGIAASEIARMAEELSADLLVMGTHGRSGFERLVLGSVTKQFFGARLCP